MPDLPSLNHGDEVAVEFAVPAVTATGKVLRAAEGTIGLFGRIAFLFCETVRDRWGQCEAIGPLSDRDAVEVLRPADEARRAKALVRRGELVFAAKPRTTADVERQLTDLADRIADEPGDDWTGRRAELLLQFGDVADVVALAKRKRTYLIKRAELGCDFNPVTWPDDRVMRKDTVRLLPADLELDLAARKDRARRLREAVRIFGETEREVRLIQSALRRQGFDALRPHPNAQCLAVRFRPSRRGVAVYTVEPSPNGLWHAIGAAPSNKINDRAQRRADREGCGRCLALALSAIEGVTTQAA